MTIKHEAPQCPDCGARTGQPHTSGCDVARCLWDGGQRLQCEFHDRDDLHVDHDCGQDLWSGRWPGEEDAERLGWWVAWDGPTPERGWDYRGRGWVRVSADHPEARPDLNRLRVDAKWDRDTRRWIV